MHLFQVFLLAAMASAGIGLLCAYAAWPKLRALHRRGEIPGRIPDLLEGRVNQLRATWLIWSAPIPKDRTRLRRLLIACRVSQGLALLLFAAGLVAITMFPPSA